MFHNFKVLFVLSIKRRKDRKRIHSPIFLIIAITFGISGKVLLAPALDLDLCIE
jgi:hypothetical protein